MISERQLNILKWIVEEYVRTAEPVGSKALSEQPQFDYSSATIRNDMAALEEQGYLLKTHTSSGRVPSVKGYKLYVSEILNQKNNDEEEFPMIDEIFKDNSPFAISEFVFPLTEPLSYSEELDEFLELINNVGEFENKGVIN